MSEKPVEQRQGEYFDASELLTSIRKRIIPTEHSDPTVEPLFINFSHGASLGDDYYLDLGIITLESLEVANNPDKVGDFAVLTRLVMSRRTVIGLRDQINSLLTRGGSTDAS